MDETLVTTRKALHEVAEHVLSAARKRATGNQITLGHGAGGVRTPPLPDGRVLALIGDEIAVLDGNSERRAPLTTVRAAADFAGVEPGFPWTKHPPGTDFEPDRALRVDGESAGVLADWFALADAALRTLAQELAPAEPPEPQVFPEHFDIAITVDEVNYGASPGDDEIPQPYLYVGPFSGPPPDGDPFWNAAFGAYATADNISTEAAALEFFHAGIKRLNQSSPAGQ
jgi:hypothetical protein